MKTFLIILVAILFSGCASTDVMQYSGAKEMQGTGGIFKTVDGIDIYSNGTPNGRFEVVGILAEGHYRGGNMLASWIGESSGRSRIIKAAKAAGADAVVMLSTDYVVSGASHSGSASTTYFNSSSSTSYSGNTVVHGRQSSTLALVKYLAVEK